MTVARWPGMSAAKLPRAFLGPRDARAASTEIAVSRRGRLGGLTQFRLGSMHPRVKRLNAKKIEERCRNGPTGAIICVEPLASRCPRERSEALPLATLNFVDAEMPRAVFHARAVPLGQKGLFGAPRFAPAHAVAHGRMPGRHRLTVHADLLPQAARDARLRARELDPLGPNPAPPTNDAPLPIDERDRMRGPGQVVPRTIAGRPHVTGARPQPLHG